MPISNRLRFLLEQAANAHKGTWVNETPEYLMRRLREKLAELSAIGLGTMTGCGVMAMERPSDEGHRHSRTGDIVSEAADIANFAMMIADVCAHPLYGNRRLEAIMPSIRKK